MPRYPRLAPAGRSTLALALLAGVGFLTTGFATGRSGFVTSPYRAERLTAITAALSNLEGDYVLAAGDSHILRWHARTFCGLPLVNAGIDGATSEDLGNLLASLDLHRPPRAVIVTIGTNDTFRKRAASPEQAARRFDAGLDRVLGDLARRTSRIVLNAPPSIDKNGSADFWAEAIRPIGTAAEAACLKTRSCRFLAPFGPGTALAADGIHLRDYDTAYARIEGPACATIRGEPAALANASP
ncbi:MAG: hypothetical protein DI527_14555 [Chelatococcus sp.]|nr:MAG: hypothetical protein DI527_14555 [Chelatococcus sp.]